MNMQNELETLLRRWAELEPLECHQSEMFTFIMRRGQMKSMDLDDDRIQSAIQEAIEARGWSWAVDGTPEGCRLFSSQALVFGVDAVADTPAAALLTAYLSAIEAQNADAR